MTSLDPLLLEILPCSKGCSPSLSALPMSFTSLQSHLLSLITSNYLISLPRRSANSPHILISSLRLWFGNCCLWSQAWAVAGQCGLACYPQLLRPFCFLSLLRDFTFWPFLKLSSACRYTSTEQTRGDCRNALVSSSLGLWWLRALVKLQAPLARRGCFLSLVGSGCQPLPVPCYSCQQKSIRYIQGLEVQ